MKSLRSSSRDADEASSSANKSLSKVSSLLFRTPFGFRLKGLENLDDRHFDDNEVAATVEVVEASELVEEPSAMSAVVWLLNRRA